MVCLASVEANHLIEANGLRTKGQAGLDAWGVFASLPRLPRFGRAFIETDDIFFSQSPDRRLQDTFFEDTRPPEGVRELAIEAGGNAVSRL